MARKGKKQKKERRGFFHSLVDILGAIADFFSSLFS